MAKRPKKSKHHRDEPFSLAVSNAIRHHVGVLAELEDDRKAAFETRDQVLGEMHAEDDGEGDEPKDLPALKIKHSDAVCAINTIADDIKYHNGELQRLVKNADKLAAEASQETLEELYTKPPEPKKDPKAEKPKEPEIPEGQDQHLAAGTVKELDLPEVLIGKLIKKGYEKVGQLVALIDGEKDLDGELNITPDQAAAVTAAVQKYRKKHRKAMAAAEQHELRIAK